MLTKRAGPCSLGSSECAKVRRRRGRICPSQPREEDHLHLNSHQWWRACGLPGEDLRAAFACALSGASMRWVGGPTCPSPSQLWLAACLLLLSVGFPEAVPIGQHPHPPVGQGIHLASLDSGQFGASAEGMLVYTARKKARFQMPLQANWRFFFFPGVELSCSHLWVPGAFLCYKDVKDDQKKQTAASS